MNSPHPELMEAYGTDTYYLEKIGVVSPMLAAALQSMAGGASIAAAQREAGRTERLLQEAEIMNRRLRILEAHKMSDVVASFGGDPNVSIAAGYEDPVISRTKMSSVDPELLKMAEAAGRILAKEAGMGGMFGKAVGAVKNMFTRGGGAGEVSNKMLNTISKGPAPNQYASTLKKGVMPAVEQGAKKKPWISTGTKVKAGLGVGGAALLAGGGYAGYKGLGAAKDYMMAPSQQGAGEWGGYGPQPRNRVNRYGHVQPNY